MFAPSSAVTARAVDPDPGREDLPEAIPDRPRGGRDAPSDAWNIRDTWEPLVSDEERRWQLRMQREMGPLVETLRRLRERDLLD